ncbi:MAG: universal stress protein [Pseudomonadales bacterium]
MSETHDTLRRILVALDPADPRSEIFSALAALLEGPGAELRGLYVEDERLFRLASLPCAREVRISIRGPRALSVIELQRDVDESATQVREAFEAEARRLRIRHSFSVRRGDVLGVIRSEATENDLLVIGRSIKSAGTRTWHGITVARIAEHPASSLLFVNEPWESGHHVAVLMDSSRGARRGLQMGVQLAEREGLDLSVFILPGQEALEELPRRAEQRTLAGVDNARLALLCRELDARMLILTDSAAVRRHIDLAALIEALPTSIILVPSHAQS